MIHCLDTPAGRAVSSTELKHWHMDPQPKGRGWSKPGYADMIHLDGSLENLIEYDEDNWISSDEISNGARGFNGCTRHIAVVGGKGFNMADFEEVLTDGQFVTLQIYIKEFLGKHPDCKVLGHYEVNPHKACPGFDVPAYLEFISIPEKYIYIS